MSSVFLGFCIGITCAVVFAISGVPIVLASATYVIIGAAVPVLVLLTAPISDPISKPGR